MTKRKSLRLKIKKSISSKKIEKIAFCREVVYVGADQVGGRVGGFGVEDPHVLT